MEREKTRMEKMKGAIKRGWQAVQNHSGEGFVDTAIKILIAVVIGALVLDGLYTLFDETVLPTLTERVQEMFNYGG